MERIRTGIQAAELGVGAEHGKDVDLRRSPVVRAADVDCDGLQP
jgi:hypothetical protein